MRGTVGPRVVFGSALVAIAPMAHAGFAKGPYLQAVTQTSIVVCWESDVPTTGQVDYGPTASLGSTEVDPVESTLHQLLITGLDPSTTYSYQVTAGGETSPLSTWLTAPLDEEPFHFVVVGDTRTDGDEHQRVMDAVVATVGHPDLYFNTGDLVEDGGAADQWADFFAIESALMLGSPLFPVAGNHDDVENDSLYVQWFHLPEESSGNEAWYAFTYGNSRFIVVDTNDDFVNGSEQYLWLEGELATALADPVLLNTFVFFHDPPFSSGAHGVFDPEDWQPPRYHLAPLFSTYGVDAVFNGHDHHYERSTPNLTGGVVYVVAGGGGAPGAPSDFVDGLDSIADYLLDMEPGETVGEYLEDHELIWVALDALGFADDYEGGWWRAEAEVVKHFISVEVRGDYVAATVYDTEGEVIDEWSIDTYDPDLVDDDGDGFTEDEGDCDDANDSVHPDAIDDDCDGVDDDCDGADEGCDDTDDTDEGDDTDDPDPDDEGDGPSCGCTATSPAGMGLFVGWWVVVLPVWRRLRYG